MSDNPVSAIKTVGAIRAEMRGTKAIFLPSIRILGDNFAFDDMTESGEAVFADLDSDGQLQYTDMIVKLPDNLPLEHDIRLGSFDYYQIPAALIEQYSA